MILRTALAAFLLFLVSSMAHANEYGSYDLRRILIVSETPAAKKLGIDMPYMDQMLNDMASHARNYPPQFDTPQDRQRAVNDARALSGLLDILIDEPTPPPELLWRAGFVNGMGHNLDIPGAAEKASVIFLKLLAAVPAHPQGNHMYGVFLAGIGKPNEALPFLEKASSLGVVDAVYALGMTYLSLGDKQKALGYLEIYLQRTPGAVEVAKLIELIRNGKVEIKRSSN